LGTSKGDFFDSVIKHAPDLAHQMEDGRAGVSRTSLPCQVFAIGDFQIRQEILRLIMGSDRLPQLVGECLLALRWMVCTLRIRPYSQITTPKL